MNNNLRLGSLFGIPFFVNPSWFLVLGLVTLTYGQQLSLFPQLTGIAPWGLGLATALLLFASVVAHELGHSLLAIAQGIEVKSITLFLFGGLANLEKESETPLEAFAVAIAGPLVSLILFGLLAVIGANLTLPLPFQAIISLLAAINLALALFNLIPGLPLDGGNILKALVWKWTGNQNQGLLWASRAGQVVGWLAVTIGGLGILRLLPVGDFWTVLVGVFLLQNAGASARQAQLKEAMAAYTAQDAVIANSPVVEQSLTLRDFVNTYVIGQTPWRQFLVTDAQGQLVGTLAVEALKTIPTSDWPQITLQAVMASPEALPQVKAHRSLFEAAQQLEQTKMAQLIVVQDSGEVVGLLEKASIVQCLQKSFAPAGI
ncbi:site-2 protease family protein [Synechocystis sp. LKSZ1]|uniref:site-2 protease family protein n=1 Tax=Synechocystis sp. LKSZ1 TaxID=3144951 RepID=UPI00336C0A5D